MSHDDDSELYNDTSARNVDARGSECATCGHVPTDKELQRGVCPRCTPGPLYRWEPARFRACKWALGQGASTEVLRILREGDPDLLVDGLVDTVVDAGARLCDGYSWEVRVNGTVLDAERLRALRQGALELLHLATGTKFQEPECP